MYEEAGAQFQKAAAAGSVAALVNMGNVASMQNDQRKALGYYTQAAGKDGSNVAAVEGMAKANYALENLGIVKELYAKLQQLSPEEAKRVAYLVGGKEEAARAAEAGDTGVVLWAE
jgi:Tfp pilus assembly protein PilF